MKKASKIILDKNKLISQLNEIDKVAKKNNWMMDYDDKLDELVYGMKIMPDDTNLVGLSDEIKLFVSSRSLIRGIFIEYFAYNFVEHEKGLKPILKVLDMDTKKEVSQKDSRLYKDLLKEKLQRKTIISIMSTSDELAMIV